MSNLFQEIIVESSNSDRFQIHLINGGGTFGLDILMNNKNNPNQQTLWNQNVGNHGSAVQKFDDAIKFIIKYLSNSKSIILFIDNPCNTPYVSKIEQEKILQIHDINVQVLVNGG